tara:strand:+ start:1083 stop:1628 length:546 start_codon:yes stop_codon:yes gene_type:complete
MNTLKNFIKINLCNNNLIDTFYKEDRNIILNSLYNKEFEIPDATIFLNQFKNTNIKNNVLENFNISIDRQYHRNLIQEPVTGDVIVDEDGKEFRLVNVYGTKFQFCQSGSFHIFKSGYSSMSGGFCFDFKHKGKELSSVELKDLVKVEHRYYRKFWFWLSNRCGANRGVYFNCEVNAYKHI